MPKSWEVESVTRQNAGVLKVLVRAPGQTRHVDVTYYRGVPVKLGEYTSADPFGDATFTMTFNQITPFDDVGTGDLEWLKAWSAVDVYLDPPTGSSIKVWEGHIASLEMQSDEKGYSVQVQCQGALFQLDTYTQLTEYLDARVPIEDLIKGAFVKHRRPHLRTTNLEVRFPKGWTKKNKHGNNITGLYSRDTGTNGQRPLTGWIQTSLLPLMQTVDNGVLYRWTVMQEFGRHPVLTPRDVITAHWTADCGPGVTLSLTYDATQNANVMFGDGTDTAGNEWHRFRISPRGIRTDYEPLAYDPRVYPISKTNKNLDTSIFRVENYTGYGSGFDENDAVNDAEQVMTREKNAGWSGTITLRSDPYEGSRLTMRAGQNILLKYFAGTRAEGTLFHIAQVSVNGDSGDVTLTVDTKGRDLLTLEEIIARNRDSHTPSRLLRAGAESTFHKDIYAPWSYAAGCGFIAPFNNAPDAKKLFLKKAGKNDQFAWDDLLKRFPPRKHPEYYLTIHAHAADSTKRWTKGQILVNHAGQIRQVQFALVDAEGNQKAMPFHVSFYSISGIDYTNMPQGADVDGKFKVSPFLPGAFSKDVSDPNYTKFKEPAQSFLIGWGDGDQKAGFWPGLQSNSSPATGRLVDEGSWSYDLTQDISSNEQLKSLRTMYVMAYAENSVAYPATEPVYLIGRIFKAPHQGGD